MTHKLLEGVEQPLKIFLPDCIVNLKKELLKNIPFCDFVLWNFDCNLASSFSSKVVLSGKMERLAQRNKMGYFLVALFEILLAIRSQTSSMAASTLPATNQSCYFTSILRKSKVRFYFPMLL